MLLSERFLPGAGWIEIVVLLIYSITVTAVMTTTRSIGKWRSRYWLLFSVLFFSKLILGVAVSDKFLMTGKLHFPIPAMIAAGPIYRGRLSYMVYIYAGTLLLAGTGWCSHLCYFGAFDDFLAKRKSGTKISEPISQVWRYAVLGLVIASALVLRYIIPPFRFLIAVPLAFGIIGLVLAGVLSTRQGRMVHCTAYCPIGGITAVLGKINPFRVRIQTDKCNRCGKCISHCRYGALTEKHLEKGVAGWNCTNCGDCLSECSSEAIGISIFSSKKNLWPIYIAIVASLHAVFLGVARI